MSWLPRSAFKRNKPVVAKSGKRRRLLAFTVALPVCVAFPALAFQLVLYRNNLAVAHETRPLTTPLKKSDRLLIISPHCDDETLGAGGVMAAARKSGARVQVVFITNGDGSRSTQLVAEARELRRQANLKRFIGRDEGKKEFKPDAAKNLFQRIAAMRRREAIEACKVLGIAEEDVIFLGYPDGGTRAMWENNWAPKNAFRSPYTKTSRSPYEFSFTSDALYCGAQVTRDLEKVIQKFQPTVVMTTHPADTHPDHWAAYAYSSAALERLRLDGQPSTRALATRAKLLTFLVHHGIWPAPHGYRPDAFLTPPASLENSGTRWLTEPLSAGTRDRKKSALEKYTSQLVWTPHYLRSFVRRNELFGEVPIAALPDSSQPKSGSIELHLLQDSPSDSSWRDAWPAADIERLSSTVGPQTLTIQANLSSAASARVHYRFALHAVTSSGVSAWTIEARRAGAKLQATLVPKDKVGEKDASHAQEISLSGKILPDGFAFELPRATLGVLGPPSTILVSGTTLVGRTRLDQTPTATLRLN